MVWCILISMGHRCCPCRLVKNCPWRTSSSLGLPEYLPTANMIFLFLQLWGSVGRRHWSLFLLGLGYLQLPRTPLLPWFYQISLQLGLGETILDSSSVHFLQCPWVRLPNDNHTGAVWDLPVCVWSNWCTLGVKWLQELLILDFFCVQHLAPLVHLGCMALDIPWDFICSCIDQHWSCLWRTGRALELFTGDCSLCGCMNCHT